MQECVIRGCVLVSPVKGVGSLRAGGTGSFKLPDVVPGTERRLSVRAVYPFNHLVASPAPTFASVPSPDPVLQRRQT